jgi:hypothetical protein
MPDVRLSDPAELARRDGSAQALAILPRKAAA